MKTGDLIQLKKKHERPLSGRPSEDEICLIVEELPEGKGYHKRYRLLCSSSHGDVIVKIFAQEYIKLNFRVIKKCRTHTSSI